MSGFAWKQLTSHSGGDENSPSVRFSTSSDAPRQGDAQSPHSRNLHDIPIPPLTGALRAATRTFSLGGRLSRTSTNTPPPQKSAANSKNSPMEASTASTPTPPKLLDADLNLGKIDNDFQNMLNDFGQRENMVRQILMAAFIVNPSRSLLTTNYSMRPPHQTTQP